MINLRPVQSDDIDQLYVISWSQAMPVETRPGSIAMGG